jgi:hypothetical protein
MAIDLRAESVIIRRPFLGIFTLFNIQAVRESSRQIESTAKQLGCQGSLSVNQPASINALIQ